MKLTATKAKSLNAPGRYADGNTLFLRIAPGGSKSWLQRVAVHGRRRDIHLGAYPQVSLAEARKLAYANRVIARAGGDPLNEAKKAAMPTFHEAAEKCHAAKLPTWKAGGKHPAQWLRSLEQHAYAVLGAMPLDAIGRAEVLRVLTPIWTAKPETARRVRQRIRAVLAWGQAHGFIEHNYAGEVIDGALPRIPANRSHFRALPHRAVGEALEVVEGSRASEAVKLCFRFLVLTAARSGEARGARWAEIDLKSRTWEVPAERMKAGRRHRVPLSGAALEVLERAKALEDSSGLIFPGRWPGKMLSDMALTKLLRDTDLAAAATVHGFRSSFRDWCAESAKRREDAEAALAHVVGGVEGAYFRSDLLDRRRVLMQSWADYLAGTAAKVVPLHG